MAADQGARPILAGRNLAKVKVVAKPLGLTARAFDLAPARIDAAIKDVSVVLCVAGPFSATSRPVADACLRNRVHYLDITGEIVAAGSLLVVASAVSQAANDKQHLEPMLDKLGALPEELGKPERLLADTRYFSAANVAACAQAGIERSLIRGRGAVCVA